MTGNLFCEVQYDYPDFKIHLLAYHPKIIKGEPKTLEHLELKWVSILELKNYEFLKAGIRKSQGLSKRFE